MSAKFIAATLAEASPDIILNATAFAVSSGSTASETPFSAFDCPVLQVVFAGTSEAAWRDSAQGLSARDLAMNVVLPELDGRILSRAVSFKADDHWDDQLIISVFCPDKSKRPEARRQPDASGQFHFSSPHGGTGFVFFRAGSYFTQT